MLDVEANFWSNKGLIHYIFKCVSGVDLLTNGERTVGDYYLSSSATHSYMMSILVFQQSVLDWIEIFCVLFTSKFEHSKQYWKLQILNFDNLVSSSPPLHPVLNIFIIL